METYIKEFHRVDYDNNFNEYENMEIIVDNLFENKNQVPTNGYI